MGVTFGALTFQNGLLQFCIHCTWYIKAPVHLICVAAWIFLLCLLTILTGFRVARVRLTLKKHLVKSEHLPKTICHN